MHKTSLLMSTAFVALAAGTPVHAQGTQTLAATEATTESDQDIVVTARRREESLLDVPIAVTAFSGAQLERQGAIDITDVSNTTPNVTIENSRATNSTLSAFIRGVGQQDPVGGFEAGVGLYLDDVYLNRPQAAVLDIYDVERIEVLRGPQGTLYGRNTIGGAIKYVTRRLSEDFEVRAKATYGSYDQADGILSVSSPIGSLFKLGGSVARLSRAGFGDNLNNGLENYNKDVWAGRGTIEFESPDNRLFVRISGDYTRDRSNPRNGHRLIAGRLSGAPVLDDVYDTRAALNNPKQDIEAYGLSMNISAQISDTITLRSISAWRKDKTFAPIDFDSLPTVDVDVPGLYANEQISQEFQLVYEGDKLQGLIGAYYLDADAATIFDVILATTGSLVGLPGLNAATEGHVNTETWSVFGDFTYNFSDQFAVSVGGRYTNDQRNSRILKQTRIGGTSPIFGGTAVTIATNSNFRGSKTFKEFTPRASVSFKPSQGHLIYASYAKGFKGGGFDPRGDSSKAPDTNRDGVRSYSEIFDFLSFDPEKVSSYELGYKASLFDRRVTIALTGFYADYRDVQVPGSVAVDNNGDGINDNFIGITSNAGKANFKGVEAEVAASLARDFAGAGSSIGFAGTLGYIDGRYKTFIDAFGNDVADFRAIQNTPKWTLSGTLNAAVPAGSGMVNASTTLSYRSLTHQFEVPSEFLDQPGYALWDASLVWASEGGRYSIGLHAKNILDKQYITSGYQFVATNPTTGAVIRNGAGNVTPSLGREGVVTTFYGNPRQLFVTAGLKF